MSKEALTWDEMVELPHRTVMFDRDNDALIKLSQGWAYTDLIPPTVEEQAVMRPGVFIRKPQAYPPYSLQKKAGVR